VGAMAEAVKEVAPVWVAGATARAKEEMGGLVSAPGRTDPAPGRQAPETASPALR